MNYFIAILAAAFVAHVKADGCAGVVYIATINNGSCGVNVMKPSYCTLPKNDRCSTWVPCFDRYCAIDDNGNIDCKYPDSTKRCKCWKRDTCPGENPSCPTLMDKVIPITSK